MHARRTRIFFPEQECNLVDLTAKLLGLNLALILGKLCKVHTRVFEIVAHRNVEIGHNN